MKSMGYEAINNVGVVFTKMPNAEPPKQKCEMIQNIFKEIGIAEVPKNIPCYSVDNYPEETSKL